MPFNPYTRQCRCGALVTGAACPRCLPAQRRVTDDRRKDAPHRRLLKSERWKRLSKRRLALHPWCVGYPLGKHGTDRVLAQCTDHIKPGHLYPELFFDPDNHASLCHACNTTKADRDDGTRTSRGGQTIVLA